GYRSCTKQGHTLLNCIFDLHLAGRSKNAKHFSGGGECASVPPPANSLNREFACLPARGRRNKGQGRRSWPTLVVAAVALVPGAAAAVDFDVQGYADVRLVVPSDQVSWQDGGL